MTEDSAFFALPIARRRTGLRAREDD